MKIYSQDSLTENDYIALGKYLSSSGILIYPTETSYAIGANALDNAAVKMIYDIKGRDFVKPLPVLVKDLNMLINIAYVGRQEEDIISKFWPGPLTILFKSKISGKYLFTSNSEFVGARISPHPFPEILFNNIDFPVTATSANISGEDGLTDVGSIKRVFKGFEEKIVLIDGGDLTGGASTIIRIEKKKVIIVREGENNIKERLVCYMKNKKIL
ncbi:MAG: L-threonylcarbamoyladenylate synthase [Deltaproteobacteria bacterium]|jgi:L-threonylcarbamoyladenylate synthase|nr:L-threonylcarbamoyladenylate synthase [Deltaproteobacteria bacterium]MCL5880121.1 L-threonylcarbamoyladenylate synthase [Deltaproteobacteria bacterium]MDA8304829.1 L-threonylcarbamoyladenylate synthase [Deltaproteobacteria bacterium]